jgi:hypothetical protein
MRIDKKRLLQIVFTLFILGSALTPFVLLV